MPANPEQFLECRGWHRWYNNDYWCHRKTVQDPTVQDYTNYGMSLEKALEYERTNAKPFPSVAPIQKAISGLYPECKEWNK